MPFLQVHTNVKRESLPPNFIEELTAFFQKLIGKPVQYIAVHVNAGQYMTWSGTQDPCAITYLCSIGKINREANQVYTQEIQKFLQEKLGIPMDRYFIKFIRQRFSVKILF